VLLGESSPLKGNIMDKRYTVEREWCGESKPMWVARFCGDWLGKGEMKPDGVMICLAHADKRKRELSHET